jgi:nucleotide-binding universal stress UspA family protein
MIWVNKPDQSKEVFISEPANLVEEVEKRFNQLIAKYQPQLKNNKISFLIRTGKVYEEIVKASEELDSFLIIVGTHGASGFEAFWVGSNAYKVVSAAERPIITIRGGVDITRSISKIVLPIDSTLETRQKVPITALISKYFDAEIHLLAVYTTRIKEVRRRVDDYVKQVDKYLTENQVLFVTETIEAENITDSTIEYATKINANLISVMDEQERKASNLWLGPYAQQMINQSPIPVLCVHARNVIAGISR